jgi:hypothetical protein
LGFSAPGPRLSREKVSEEESLMPMKKKAKKKKK